MHYNFSTKEKVIEIDPDEEIEIEDPLGVTSPPDDEEDDYDEDEEDDDDDKVY
jgi:hypothetical protein